MLRRSVVLLLPGLLVACGSPRAMDEGRGAGGQRARHRYEATTLVLQARSRPPMLCLGGVLLSLPPQCGEVRVSGWHWDGVKGEKRMRGTVWGRYHVVGEFDGEVFALERVSRARPGGSPHGGDPIGTPCREPDRGWRVPDPSRARRSDVDAANAAVRRDPQFAGLWIEQLDGADATARKDDADILLNVAFTGEMDHHRKLVRKHWGGPLCLVRHPRGLRELSRIRSELTEDVAPDLGMEVLWSDLDVEDNVVELGVVVADRGPRAALADRYGAATVRVFSALRRVD